jgi:hypothetical protein
MIEKKLILCGILAIAIGVATVLPLEYLMSADAQAAPLDKPWTNLNVPYAYWDANLNGANSTTTFCGERHNAVANITITPDALKDADARIEYYQLQVYSDQGPIYNLTYYVGVAKPGELVNTYNSTLYFSGGNLYSTNSTSGGMFITDLIGVSYQGLISGSTLNYNASTIPQTVADLQNANELYIDVSRLCSIAFDGNTTTVITESNNVIQHIELTKSGSGFLYDSGASLNLPFPLWGPSTTQNPSNVTIPNSAPSPVLNFTNQP